jgi:hypothetical protein
MKISVLIKMFKFRSLEPSNLKTKKWRINFTNSETGKTKTVNFGAKGYRDFTLIDDRAEALKTREAYRARHAGDNLTDPLSPGALSWYLLWGDSQNLKTNLRAYMERFRL